MGEKKERVEHQDHSASLSLSLYICISTAILPAMADAPAPTSEGVLGITRTTRGAWQLGPAKRALSIADVGTPAAMLMTVLSSLKL